MRGPVCLDRRYRWPLRLMLGAALLSPGLAALAAADGGWLQKVSPKEHAALNPYATDERAVKAGAMLYRRSCASCHGADGLGRGSHPSVRSARVRGATDGDLHSLLTNGSLGRGMPSWSRLPDAQRWQIVRYLHTLPLETDTSR